MELIIGLIVIAAVGYIVFRKKDEPLAEAPYKVETPTVTAVGEPPATVVVEGAGLVTIAEEVKVVEAPVVAEAPAKAPRKPRAPKAETVAKPAAKKAAPKKAAAIKATPKTTRSKKA